MNSKTISIALTTLALGALGADAQAQANLRYPYSPLFANNPVATASGTIQALCTTPGGSSIQFGLTDLGNTLPLTIGNTNSGTTLSFMDSRNANCSSSGGIGMPEGCFLNGTSSVVSGPGVSYDVTGSLGMIQVEIDSSRDLTASVVSTTPGMASASSSAEFFTRAPLVLEIPFLMPINGTGVVGANSAMISRMDGQASGKTNLDWKVFRDTNRNSIVDPGEPMIGTGGGIEVSETGIMTNNTSNAYVLPREFYVLEVTYTTTGKLTATAPCNSSDIKQALVTDDVELQFDIAP